MSEFIENLRKKGKEIQDAKEKEKINFLKFKEERKLSIIKNALTLFPACIQPYIFLNEKRLTRDMGAFHKDSYQVEFIINIPKIKRIYKTVTINPDLSVEFFKVKDKELGYEVNDYSVYLGEERFGPNLWFENLEEALFFAFGKETHFLNECLAKIYEDGKKIAQDKKDAELALKNKIESMQDVIVNNAILLFREELRPFLSLKSRKDFPDLQRDSKERYVFTIVLNLPESLSIYKEILGGPELRFYDENWRVAIYRVFQNDIYIDDDYDITFGSLEEATWFAHQEYGKMEERKRNLKNER